MISTEGIKRGDSYLDHHRPFIEPDGDLVGLFPHRDAPRTLQPVAQRVLQPIRAAVPDLHRPVLAPTDDDREVGVEDRKRDVVGVALHRLNAALAEVVPDLDRFVVAGRDEVRLVRAGVELDVVDALAVRLHREVGHRRAERPDLDRAVQTRGGERVCVFEVDGDVHDIMRVPFVRLQAHPSASVLSQDRQTCMCVCGR